MKVRNCSRCGERGTCAQAGPHGAWICQRCLYLVEEREGEAPATDSE